MVSYVTNLANFGQSLVELSRGLAKRRLERMKQVPARRAITVNATNLRV
jgi:hypothetical protein